MHQSTIRERRKKNKNKNGIFKVSTIHITDQATLLEYGSSGVFCLPHDGSAWCFTALHTHLISFDTESCESNVNWLNFLSG